MKNRSGFVSNSSSSSFIIAWKGDYDEDDLRLMFREVCNIPLESPIAWAHELIFNCLFDNIDEKFDTKDDFIKWTESNCYMQDEYKAIVDLLDKGFVVRFGWCSTESGSGNPVEYRLASKELNYTSDDFVIIHDGTY